MDARTLNETSVLFRSSQGVNLEGKVLRIAPHQVICEIYSLAEEVLRVSEALEEFKVIWHDQVLYSGRAVVRSLMPTGLATVCNVALGDAWVDIKGAGGQPNPDGLPAAFARFLQDWQQFYRVSPAFKVVLADMHTFFTDLRLWLEHVEVTGGNTVNNDQSRAQLLAPAVVPAIANLFEKFEDISAGIDPELLEVHWAIGKRFIHPLLLRSPFVHRTYTKPLGYAGDYEMVNMMFRDPLQGPSLFAKMINVYALQLPPIRAHRNRISLLTGRLRQESLRLRQRHRPFRVFTLGCGPAQEIQQLLGEPAFQGPSHFTLADFNDETLAHAALQLKGRGGRRHQDVRFEFIKRSVHQLLKQAERKLDYPAAEQFDVIYCAGLFDYLSDKVCRRLMDIFYSLLADEGLLITTNVDVHPARHEMECFLDWHLVHRSTAQFRGLVPLRIPADQVNLMRDGTGVNLFLEIRKSLT